MVLLKAVHTAQPITVLIPKFHQIFVVLFSACGVTVAMSVFSVVLLATL